MIGRALLVAIAASACAVAPPTPPPGQRLASDLIQEGATTTAALAGRSFDLTPLSAQISGSTKWSLEILGDGVVISFAAQAAPHVPAVAGNVVTFGGHTFEATAAPNDFKVDGRPLHLDRGGAYAISEGRFLGRVR